MSSALEDLTSKRVTLPGSAARPVPGFDSMQLYIHEILVLQPINR